ncbi:MAG: hypothetical protein IT343_06230 [Candidatus Melainabacteria bacterium]|jgi:uncharacterized membrane protein|nr:hypothetical protein [Candidatus Melainabacteria bacterium]
MPVINAGKKFPGYGGGGNNTEMLERAMAGLCYLTVGISGLIYTIIGGRFARTNFFRTHFLQAILLGIMGMLLGSCSSILANILGGILEMIPGMNSGMVMFIPITIAWIIRLGMLLLVYGLVMSLLGKYAPIPMITKLVNQQMR